MYFDVDLFLETATVIGKKKSRDLFLPITVAVIGKPFLQTATVIGWNKSRDSFQPAVCKNK